jgi:hypothetical protein
MTAEEPCRYEYETNTGVFGSHYQPLFVSVAAVGANASQISS